MSWRPFPTVEHRVDRAAIDEYAELSGDYNPLHMDPEFAAATQFGGVIAHGPIGLQALFEAVTTWLGVECLPPSVSIDVSYRGPVRIDSAVVCGGELIADHAGAVVVRARCRNGDGEEILQALVVVPRVLVPRAP